MTSGEKTSPEGQDEFFSDAGPKADEVTAGKRGGDSWAGFMLSGALL
jgi:hypothetical protein